MAMSNAERQRKYRLNRDSDPRKRQEYLKKEKEKYAQDKSLGKKKLVKDMTDREKRHARKLWRTNKKKLREKQKEAKELERNLVTPPSSPGDYQVNEQQGGSRQKKQEQKRRNRERAKVYRDNIQKELEIKMLKKKLNACQKQIDRLKKGKAKIDSPRTKTRKLLRNFNTDENVKKTVKRSLFAYNVLVNQLKQKYSNEKKRKEKLKMAQTLSGEIVKKYRMKKAAFKLIGVSVDRHRSRKKGNLTKRIQEKVKAFYLREDNSRVVAGVKSTVTKGKKKKQRRLLKDSLKNLYEKFLSEGDSKPSYTVFTRLRPFWVLLPTDADRNTCLCKTCENFDMKLKVLHKANLIDCNNADDLIQELVCDASNYNCMYSLCEKCKNKNVNVNENEDVLDKTLLWSQWKLKIEKRTIKDGKDKKEKAVTFTVKENETSSAQELLNKLEKDLDYVKKHIYNCRAQLKYFRCARESLDEKSCIVHVDFSENYVCKMSDEVQAMHFGASKKQISLHTGVVYLKKSKETFCTVSDCLEHGPGAIWAHMNPILSQIRQQHPYVRNIEFFSDGPSSQYRQKGNFFLLTTEAPKYGFETAKWNFFESNHGKGVPDAIGGSVKRTADSKVLYGEDIVCASDFVKQFKDSKIKVSLISEKEIQAQQEKLANEELQAVNGTLKTHQVIAQSAPGKILFRKLSCNCSSITSSNACSCLVPLEEHDLLNAKYKKKRKLSSEKSENKSKKIKVSETEARVTEIKSSNARTIKAKERASTFIKPEKQKEFQECIETENIDMKREEEQKLSSDRDIEQENVRKSHFNDILSSFSTCKTFTALKKKCKAIDMKAYRIQDQRITMCSHPHLEADFNAADYMPSDIETQHELCPCKVHANGNCLPSSASVLAFGETGMENEMRVRIIHELVINEEKYLSNEYLAVGSGGKSDIAKQYAQYSEEFIPGTNLNRKDIRYLYRKEVLSITENNSYMGIWQIHALATVLNTPIHSIYPNLGNPNVRNDLHRLVVPISRDNANEPLYIMWTSNREDMRRKHWVPNHFVPLLPILLPSEADMLDKEQEENKQEHDPGDEEAPGVTVYVYKNAKGLYELRLEDRVIGTVDQPFNTKEGESTESKTSFTEETDGSATILASKKFKDDGTEITPDSSTITQSTGQADEAEKPDQMSQAHNDIEQSFEQTDKGTDTGQLSSNADDETKIETAKKNCTEKTNDDSAKQHESQVSNDNDTKIDVVNVQNIERKYDETVEKQLFLDLNNNQPTIDNTNLESIERAYNWTTKQPLSQTMNDCGTKIDETNTHYIERTDNGIVEQLLSEIVNDIAAKIDIPNMRSTEQNDDETAKQQLCQDVNNDQMTIDITNVQSLEQTYTGTTEQQLSPTMDIIDTETDTTNMQRSVQTDSETAKLQLSQTINDSVTKIVETNTHDVERTDDKIVEQLLSDILNDIVTKIDTVQTEGESAKQKIFHTVTNNEVDKETEYMQVNTQESMQYNDQELEKKNTTQSNVVMAENSHNKQIKRMRRMRRIKEINDRLKEMA